MLKYTPFWMRVVVIYEIEIGHEINCDANTFRNKTLNSVGDKMQD